jgi:DNA-binding NarL/FixJ family response regulator
MAMLALYTLGTNAVMAKVAGPNGPGSAIAGELLSSGRPSSAGAMSGRIVGHDFRLAVLTDQGPALGGVYALLRGSLSCQTRRPPGPPAQDLCRYCGLDDLHKVLEYCPCPACWAVCEGQVSGPVSTKASGHPAREPIGVFVLDDQEIVRRGVRGLLEADPDIRVIGEADSASAALASIPALRPDVAVLDVRLPDGDGVLVCREVRSRAPEVACLMFTAFSDDQALLDSIMAGAAGYVLKQIRGSDLVGAVRMAASGQPLLSRRAASDVMARMLHASGKHDPLARLTPHERSVLELIGQGLTNRQIGERLFLAEKTVKNYSSTLFAKLGLAQRTEAAAYAARLTLARS